MVHVLVGLGAVVTALGVALSVRLLRSAHALWTAPELALGLFFFVSCVIGYVPRLIGAELVRMDPMWAVPFYKLGFVGLILGAGAMTWFTWKVFRPESGAAGIYTGLVTVASIVVAIAVWRTGTGLAGDDPLFGVRTLLTGASVGWACFESVNHWLRSRKRAALGLAEPMDVNRFAVWGLSMGLMLGMTLIRFLSTNFLPAPQVGSLSSARIVVSLIQTAVGLGIVGSIWFTFYPPTAYRRWVEGATAAA